MIRAKGNMKKRCMLVALAFVIVAGGEVLGIRGASAASPAKRTTLRMMIPSEPSEPGPLGGLHGGSANAEPLVDNIMEPLVEMGKEGKAVPKLATSWEHSADFTKWRFNLRRGVKFHNGADFTARDVVAFFKWLIELGPTSMYLKYLPLKDVAAVNDYTVDVTLSEPRPLLIMGLRQVLIPPAAISRDNRQMYTKHPTGTGPYRFVEWNRGLYIKLTKFENYWGLKPEIDDVMIIFREEEAVRLAALINKEVDWVYGLNPESASRAPKIVRTPSFDTLYLRFDESVQKDWTKVDPIFADKRLRLAVDYAIDRQVIVTIFNGFATPSLGQFASPRDFGFNPALKNRPYDLEKAKALVREAGAVGKTVTFISPVARIAKDKEAAESVAYMIEQTGLKVDLKFLPRPDYNNYWNTYGKFRQYMSDIFIKSSDTVLEAESRFPFLFVEGGQNYALNDLEPTRLFNDVMGERNLARRAEKLGKVWAYVYEQVHYVPLIKPDFIWGIAKNLKWDVDIAGRPFVADMKFTD